MSDKIRDEFYKKLNSDYDGVEAIVGCLPISYKSTPPDDQPGCIVATCEYCKKNMWLSKAKRDLLSQFQKENKPVLYGCMYCVLVISTKGGLLPIPEMVHIPKGQS